MMASVGFLTFLVMIALIATCITPPALLWLLYKDWKGRTLW